MLGRLFGHSDGDQGGDDGGVDELHVDLVFDVDDWWYGKVIVDL